jgi:hypothetical protein
MATNTYVALDKITLGTAAASVTFSSISSAYTDLVIVINAKASTAINSYMQVGNGSVDTGSNYSRTGLNGNGSAASSYRNASIGYYYLNDVAGVDASNFDYVDTVHLMNYANTTTYKTFMNRCNNATFGVGAQVGMWRSTVAINTVLLGVLSGTWAVGSTFSLYGIASSAVGAKATGGIISSDANYYYHTFAASGTFTPLSSLSADVLIVAGGAGSGYGGGGGGGAGGLLGFTSQTLSGNSTITVGAGGAGSPTSSQAGVNGSNSQFAALTASVGGGGGDTTVGTGGGKNGGSGGGGNGRNTPFTGGTGTSGQGTNGGAGQRSVPNDNEPAGGGGGATVAGGAGSITTTGNGGNGSSAYSAYGSATSTGQNISGTYWFAGGGAGGNWAGNVATMGVGGNGGGASAPTANSQNGNAGSANTGGGASGGTGAGVSGASGGSGVVIVRYAK